MAQKLEVAAADHGDGAFDQTDHRVAQRRGFPGVRGDARFAEYGSGDLAIAGAVLTAIGRLQHQPKASPLLRRDTRVLRDRAPMPRAPESGDGLDVSECVVAQRNERSEMRLRRAAWKEEEFDAAGSMQRVDTFGARALIAKAGGRHQGER
ncbi:hypothetical protein SAMN05216337_100788 [Bradyrhizobium brasilense]|uniref:Uncharacterized protein n=1 Tax=Bradyrhizobium brasilense TaxID=1419277 RepID=A0A1G6RQ95_9BRAD|nr:hypothetical protein SAMN05216337_100788 [Bradyrhizobium brasilense]